MKNFIKDFLEDVCLVLSTFQMICEHIIGFSLIFQSRKVRKEIQALEASVDKKENLVSRVWLDLLAPEVSQEIEDPQDHLDPMENLYV